MQVILNVGLQPSPKLTTRREPFEARHAMDVLLAAGLVIDKAQVLESQTERTLVVHGDDSALRTSYYRIASILSQDCIAVYWPNAGRDGVGQLIGPRADDWGVFNPEHFLEGN